MRWKEVKEIQGLYSISDTGLLRNNRSGRIMKPKRDKDGYHEYCMCVNNTRRYRRAHRLVATAFIPKVEGKTQVNHKDGNKTNNTPENLEWVDTTENTIHYYRELYDRGERGLICDITKSQWQEVVTLHTAGNSYPEINKILNLNLELPDSMSEVLSTRRLTSITGFTKDMRVLGRHDISKTITDQQVYQLLMEYYLSGTSNRSLSKKYGIQPSQVTRITKGTRRKEVYKKFIEDNNIG